MGGGWEELDGGVTGRIWGGRKRKTGSGASSLSNKHNQNRQHNPPGKEFDHALTNERFYHGRSEGGIPFDHFRFNASGSQHSLFESVGSAWHDTCLMRARLYLLVECVTEWTNDRVNEWIPDNAGRPVTKGDVSIRGRDPASHYARAYLGEGAGY